MEKNNRITQESSNKIVNMSLLCALLVISIHLGYSEVESGVIWWIASIFSDGYSRIAVPFFFVVSGYFLAGHCDEEGWWCKETLKRCRTVLLPFVAWAFLYEVVFIPLSIIADLKAGRPFGTNVSFMDSGFVSVFGIDAFSWPTSVPLWFLRALFLFVLLSGVIRWGLSRWPRVWILSLAVAAIALGFAPDPGMGGWSGLVQRCFSVSGLLYFSLGMHIRLKDVCLNSRSLAIWSAAIGLFLLCSQIVLRYCHIHFAVSLIFFAIPFMMYATWYFMPSRKLPNWLCGVSFPIYLMHMLVIGYWGIFSKNIAFPEVVSKIFIWPMAFVGCIAIANLLRRWTPRVFGVLFGGR